MIADQRSGHADESPGLRPELDGLRGVAIALVVLFHAGAIGGGYVGVDLFFVISGFLISRLLLRELRERGRIDLLGFYARRVLRLLPAATVAFLATGLLVYIAAPVTRLASVGAEISSAATFTINLLLHDRGWDYFRGLEWWSPLKHAWSLALEEQFYLLWPALLGLLWWLGRRRIALVGLGVALIFAGSLWFSANAGPPDYFLLQTRAFELAAGAALALVAASLERLPGPVRLLAGIGGLALVIASALSFDKQTPFPGTLALIPVLGGALLIAGGPHGIGRLLSLAPLTALGRRSYALYLVHYPIFIVLFNTLDTTPPLEAQLKMIALALVATEALHRLVENPARRSSWWLAHPRLVLGAGAAMVALVVGVGALLPTLAYPVGSGSAPAARLADLPSAHLTETVPTNLTPSLVDAAWREVEPPLSVGCLVMPGYEPPLDERCQIGDPEGSRTVFVIGDSHTHAWGGAIGYYGKEHDLRVVSWGGAGCLNNEYALEIERAAYDLGHCPRIRAEALDWAERERPDIVVMVGAPFYYYAFGEEQLRERLPLEIERWVARYRALGAAVLFLGSPPNPGFEVAQCLAANLDRASACTFIGEETRTAEAEGLERDGVARGGGAYLDTFDLVCPTERCPVILGDTLIYALGDHISKRYATVVSEPLGAAIEELLAER
jgi:peptidoglycan/LPS O-acetylase OafA/YrhL